METMYRVCFIIIIVCHDRIAAEGTGQAKENLMHKLFHNLHKLYSVYNKKSSCFISASLGKLLVGAYFTRMGVTVDRCRGIKQLVYGRPCKNVSSFIMGEHCIS